MFLCFMRHSKRDKHHYDRDTMTVPFMYIIVRLYLVSPLIARTVPLEILAAAYFLHFVLHSSPWGGKTSAPAQTDCPVWRDPIVPSSADTVINVDPFCLQTGEGNTCGFIGLQVQVRADRNSNTFFLQ
eukprot:scpid108218/ scgid8198/ 